MTILVTYSENKEIRIISQFIADRIHSDCIEIKDLNKKSGFFNNIISDYKALRSSFTTIEPNSIDFSEYNLILLGSPSILGKPSPAILTLINNCDFKNKDVIIYTTTRSSKGTSVLKELKKKIESKGGKILNSCIFRVNEKTEEELIMNTLKVIYELDLDLYV